MTSFPTQLPFATDYFRQLAALSDNFQVTEQQSQPISFSDGISQAAALVERQTKQQKKVIFIGNGGSASVASHQAVDYWRNGGFPAIAFNDSALLTCVSNDFGYEQVFSKPISMFAQPGDVLFAISSSGNSSNIITGARQAIQVGCSVVTLSAFKPDNQLRQLGNLNFYVPTMSYGFAEITHLCICHCILDGLMKGSLPELETLDNSMVINSIV